MVACADMNEGSSELSGGRRLSAWWLVPLWVLAISVVEGSAILWRLASGAEPPFNYVLMVLWGVLVAGALVPTMTMAFLVARWRRFQRRRAFWVTLSPAILILAWMVVATGFQSPARWALTDWLKTYFGVDVPASARWGLRVPIMHNG